LAKRRYEILSIKNIRTKRKINDRRIKVKEYQNKIEKIKIKISDVLEELADYLESDEMTSELIEEEIKSTFNFIKNNYLEELKEIEEEGYELTSEEAFDLRYDILEAEMMGN